MEIKKIDDSNIDLVRLFLQSVPSISEIDDEILRTGYYLVDDDVMGVLSYEKVTCYGLIRYFVFKKKVELSDVYKLFEEIKHTAKADRLKAIFAIINNEELKNIFFELGFSEANKKNVFINEECILNGLYKDSIIMIKKI